MTVLTVLLFAAAYAYNHLLTVCMSACLPARAAPRWLPPLLALVNAAALTALVYWDSAFIFLHLIFCALLAAEHVLLFRSRSPSGLLLACGFGPFLLLCVHGVLIPAFSLARGSKMQAFVRSPSLFALTLVCAFVLSIALLAVCARRIPKSWIAPLLTCAPQRRLACTCLYLLFGYLVLESFVYTNDYPGAWLPWFHLLTSVIALAAFFMLLWYAVDVSAYIENELKTRQVEKQLQRQVVHYQQYTRHVNDLRAFKHDCRHMVDTARHLLGSGEPEKALELLGEMRREMDVSLRYTQYSNHVVVDAILQECAGRCRERGIAFTALVNLPETLGLGDLELCRIFGNLADNAYEACAQCTGADRFIALDSHPRDGWLTVQIRNSCTGALPLRDGLPLTHKQDAAHHGLGLPSVRQLMESTGGFLQIETEPGVFTVRLHFCAL